MLPNCENTAVFTVFTIYWNTLPCQVMACWSGRIHEKRICAQCGFAHFSSYSLRFWKKTSKICESPFYGLLPISVTTQCFTIPLFRRVRAGKSYCFDGSSRNREQVITSCCHVATTRSSAAFEDFMERLLICMEAKDTNETVWQTAVWNFESDGGGLADFDRHNSVWFLVKERRSFFYGVLKE